MHAVLSSSLRQRTIPSSSGGGCEHVAKVLSRLSPKKHASVIDTAPLLIALLMDQPRTASQLAEVMDAHISSIKRWLTAFEAAGVLTWDADPSRVNRFGPGRIWRMHLPRAAA